MPRRREVEKREILPDPQYHDRLVARCINSLMFDGKKSVAESIMYGTLDILAARTKGGEDSSLDVFKKAVDNARPSVEVKSRRVGGFHLSGSCGNPCRPPYRPRLPLAHR